jgi:hypothetical protein
MPLRPSSLLIGRWLPSTRSKRPSSCS